MVSTPLVKPLRCAHGSWSAALCTLPAMTPEMRKRPIGRCKKCGNTVSVIEQEVTVAETNHTGAWSPIRNSCASGCRLVHGDVIPIE